MAASLYSTARWKAARARAIERDGNVCAVGRLFGGPCSSRLEVHHVVPLSEGGAPYALSNLLTCCSCCHRRLEAMRRVILARRNPPAPRCHHRHPTLSARLLCETRLARQRQRVAA